MKTKKGFTLMEMLVVLVVVGITVAIVLPNLSNSIEQTKAQSAQNNLMAIAAAQSKYFEDQTPNTYANCATNNACVATFQLSIPTTDPFTYNCVANNVASPHTFTCSASDGTVTLSTAGAGVTCTAGGVNCPAVSP